MLSGSLLLNNSSNLYISSHTLPNIVLRLLGDSFTDSSVNNNVATVNGNTSIDTITTAMSPGCISFMTLNAGAAYEYALVGTGY